MINLGEDYDKKLPTQNATKEGSGESAKLASSSLKVKENAAAAQIDDGDIGKSYEEKVQVRREHFSNWLIDEFKEWRDKIGGANTLLFSALVIRGVSYGEYFDLVQKTYKESTRRAADFLRKNLGTLKGYHYEKTDLFDENDKDIAVRACTEYCVKNLPSEIPYDNAELIKFFGKKYEEKYAEQFQDKLNFDDSEHTSLTAENDNVGNNDATTPKMTKAEFIALMKEEIAKEEFNARRDLWYRQADSRYMTRYEFFNGEFQKEQELFAQYADRKTGFDSLDAKQIFAPGLYVLGGLPSIGKSTLAWQLADKFADAGESVVYISYEMSPIELYAKTVSREVYLNSNKVIRCPAVNIQRKLYGEGVEVQKQLDKFSKEYGGAAVFKVGTESADKILESMRKMTDRIKEVQSVEHKLKQPIFFIDYLQLVAVGAKEVRTAIDEFVRHLKIFQQETHSTVICISSFNRDNYSNSVGFESFKESGGIEYTADVVLGMQFACMKDSKAVDKRDLIQKARQDNPRKINLVCLKNRFGGVYDVDFDYYPDVNYFTCEESDKKQSTKSYPKMPSR